MGKPFKVVNNSDPGDLDHYGGDDIDNIATTLNAQSDYHTYTYFVYKESTTYKAKRGTDGTVAYSNSSFATLMQTIIDSIGIRDTAAFTKIKLAPGVYVATSEILIEDKYNIHIEGSGAGLTRLETNCTSGTRMLTINGSVPGTAKNLTANGTVKAMTVTVSTANSATFSEGDWVLLSSSKAFWTSGSAKQGEFKQIDSINTGTGVITFTTPLFDTYNTADTANIIKINFAQNIVFSDLTITKNASFAGTGGYFKETFVNGFKLNNVILENPVNSFDKGISFVSCINGLISDCQLIMDESITTNDQYGIAIENCSQQVMVTNCTSTGRYRHPFEAGNNVTQTNGEGICRSITFNNCSGSDCHEAVFDNHSGGEGIQYIGCHVTGKRLSYGIQARSLRTKINNCYVRGSSLEGINLFENAHESEITNTTIVNSLNGGIQLIDSIKDVRIQGCTIKSCTNEGILLGTGCDRAIIQNNVIISGAGDGIDVTNCDNCIITGNTIKDNGGWGIDFEAATCTNNIISNNNFTNNTSGAIESGAQTGNIEFGNFGYAGVINQANTFGAANNQIFPSGRLHIRNPAGDAEYWIHGDNITADYDLLLPLITGTDYLVTQLADATLSNKVLDNTCDVSDALAGERTFSGATVDINTTAAETDLLNYVVPAGSMCTNGSVRFLITGYLLQNQATGTTYTFAVKFGTTTMWADVSPTIAQSATKIPFRINGEISNKNSTSAQCLSGMIRVNDTGAATTGLGDISSDTNTSPPAFSGNFDSEGADTTKDTTSNQTLQVTVTMSVSNSATHTVVKHKEAEVKRFT